MPAEVTCVGGHQRRLAHGGAGLLARKIGGALRKPERIDTGGHGSAGDNDDGNPIRNQPRDVTAERAELRGVEGTASFAGKDSGSEFQDNGTFLHLMPYDSALEAIISSRKPASSASPS